jgi:metal-responsive CopG/Arc/MetJ family transcriptional regulator
MKDEQILIRLSSEELERINRAYKQELIENDLISRSEFIRRLIEKGLGR